VLQASSAVLEKMLWPLTFIAKRWDVIKNLKPETSEKIIALGTMERFFFFAVGFFTPNFPIFAPIVIVTYVLAGVADKFVWESKYAFDPERLSFASFKVSFFLNAATVIMWLWGLGIRSILGMIL
jgi:hypothetical protein